jgi:hypothetical protein
LDDGLDDAAQHARSLPGDLSRAAAATHIGHFFAWALERGLLSERHVSGHAAEVDKVRRGWWSGRDYVLHVCEGRLSEEDLSGMGRGFARAYYATGRYLSDYDERLSAGRPSRYHVRDAPEAQRAVAALLDERFAEWQTQARPARAVGAGPPSAALLAPPGPRGTPEVARVQSGAAPAAAAPARPPTAAQHSDGERPLADPAARRSAPHIEVRGPSRAERWRRLWAHHRGLSESPGSDVGRAWRRIRGGGEGFGARGAGLILLVVLLILTGFAQCSEERSKSRRRSDPYRLPRPHPEDPGRR